MDAKANYTIIGIFVPILTSILIFGFLYLTVLKNTKVYKTYLVFIEEDVSGLNIESPVRYSGVKVGFVKAIELNRKNPKQVRLTLQIEDGTPVNTGTTASLQTEGLTGIDYVGLKAKSATAPLLLATPGQAYPVIPTTTSLLVRLGALVEDLAKSLKEVGDNMGQFFNEKNRRSTEILLANSAKVSGQLPATIRQLNATLRAMENASVQVGGVSRKGQTAVQGFSQQLIPEAQTLLRQLNQIARHLDQVSSDMQRNPSIILRGQKPAAPGPGE